MDNQTELLTIERSKTITIPLIKSGSNSPVNQRGSSFRNSEPVQKEVYDQIPVDEDKLDFKLAFPLTLEGILEMLEYFKKGGVLHYNYVSKILKENHELYKNVANLQEMSIPESVHFTVVGDLHGQLEVTLTQIVGFIYYIFT